MFESLKKYFAQRRIEREEAAYRDGFEWAMGELYLEQKSIAEVQSFVDDHGEAMDHFDQGALGAIDQYLVSNNADDEESPVGVQQISILYRMARLLRNTDGLHPSTSGPRAGQLLGELRLLDCGRYYREVM